MVPVGGNTSAVNKDTWGEAIQVVYGCATIKGVPLMLQVVSGQAGNVALDGVNTENVGPRGACPYGLASGPVASVDGVVYEAAVRAGGDCVPPDRLGLHLGWASKLPDHLPAR